MIVENHPSKRKKRFHDRMDDSNELSSSESDEETSHASHSGSEEEQMDNLRHELGDVPFEDLAVLEKKLGETKYGEVMFGTKKEKTVAGKKQKLEKSELFAESRKKKDSRPLEVSSKQRPSGLRKVVKTNLKLSRDPRFDDLSGTLNLELFKKSYSFLDDVKKKEKKAVTRQLKREKNPERKAALHKLLQQMEQKEKADIETEQKKERERQWKKGEKEAIKQGKRPFYLKKSEKTKMVLADKYEKLKDSGKLEKYLSKKRKRNAAKDRKYLPKKRTQER